jgi:endonuclease/exonuclease/phosphatase family metal-dependent hydrolase
MNEELSMIKIIKVLIITILSLVVIAAIFVGVLTFYEYKPDDVETIEIVDNQSATITLDQALKIMTFNIGYAGLGADEDFVMDGGKNGRPESKETVETYLDGIQNLMTTYSSDFYLLQEVDLKARRSYEINQLDAIKNEIGPFYSSQFAYNFKAIFVPFPLSFTDYIGHVESGLTTFSSYHIEESTRYQFPGSFSWPLRVANLKRAMMVSELDIESSDKKLMIVNLHMSAYDGDGSLRQAEMAFLKDFMEEQTALGNYVLIGGDFNQTFPEAKDIYPEIEGLYQAFEIEDNYLPSFYSFMIDITHPSCRLLNQPYDPESENTQYYIIDGFIVSNNIQILPYNETMTDARAYTINDEFQYSDHNPVVMNFKLLP